MCIRDRYITRPQYDVDHSFLTPALNKNKVQRQRKRKRLTRHIKRQKEGTNFNSINRFWLSFIESCWNDENEFERYKRLNVRKFEKCELYY